MLYRYTGITSDNKEKRGFIEADNSSAAISELKAKEDIVLIFDMKPQSKNPFLKGTVSAIQKQIELINNKKAENKIIQEKKKKDRIRKKKEKILKDEPNFLEKLSKMELPKPSKKKKVVEVDEDVFNKMFSMFNNKIQQENQSKTEDDEFDIIIRQEKKPQLRKEVSKPLEASNEKKIDWDLIDNSSNNPLYKDHLKLKVKTKEIILFTRRLQIMLSSGMTLVKSLMILGKTDNKTMQYITNTIIDDIQSGTTFSEALAKFPNQFDYSYIALISIGESSGTLEQVLLDILELKEKKEKVNKKMKSATIYPSIIGIVLILILFLGSVFFIPAFEDMFTEQEAALPFITRVVFRVADFLPFIIGAVILLFGMIKILLRKSRTFQKIYRKYFDLFLLSFKPIKNMMVSSYMYNFSFTVALMLKNGIRLKDALTLSQKTINNIYIKNEIINITTLMVQGLTFSDAMSKQPHFDSILVNVILTGEESGQLSFSLSQIADYYNDELGRHIDKVSELAQPVSIILISIIIIPVVIAIYLPIFDLSSGALI